MKKILLSLIVTVLILSLSAQTQSGYVPFHQYLLNNHGDIQKSEGNSREISYSEIAYMHYAPINDSDWTYSDSGQFYYNQIILDTTPVYETGGTYFEFSNVSWDTSGQFTSTANGLGLPLTITGQTEDTSTKVWTNSYLYTNTYNAINYLGSHLYQTWNGAWVNASQYTYTYNAGGYDSITLVQSGNPLQNDTQYLYTFNSFENTELVTQVWSGSAWTNLYKQVNQFDPYGNMQTSLISVWTGSGWNPYAQIIWGFVNTNELSSYSYGLWNANLGEFVHSYQESYDWELGNNTQFRNYNWDSTLNNWVPVTWNTYSFDGNHNIISESDLLYTNGAFANSALYYYYYEGYTVSGIKNVSSALNMSLYPNPSSGSAIINFTAQTAGNLLLNIYDAQGNLLKQQKASTTSGQNQIPVNVENYSAGNYFVQVVDGASGKSGVLQLLKQ
jgi:hypothetical protein